MGEKLFEAQVARAFEAAGARAWAAAGRTGYQIYLDGGSREVLEQCLCENPYLAQALKLAPFDYHVLPKGWELDRIATIAHERQCRAGDVKLPVLLPYRE